MPNNESFLKIVKGKTGIGAVSKLQKIVFYPNFEIEK